MQRRAAGAPDAEAEGDALERGRGAYAERAWRDAYEALTLADRAVPLEADDLVLLAIAAFMVGRDAEYRDVLERAHHAYLDAGDVPRAVRCAFWIGINSAQRGEPAHATGWLARAQRLIAGRDCVEQGYLLVAAMMQQEAAGDLDAAFATAVATGAVGERFGDADLVAMSLHEQGRILFVQGRIEAGAALLDEVMVAVGTGEVSPPITGLIYCSVIEGCHRVYEVGRAREWTAALTRWCDEQPQLVSFTGRCLVHRAEVMQVDGAWADALAEARRAGERFAQVSYRVATGEAFYRQAEIHRLRGARAAAEAAYAEASLCGWEPQPGLALLRLAQGDLDAARAAIRRVAAEVSDPLRRAGLLPAFVEIMLAAGDLEAARGACDELEELAERFGSPMLVGTAAHARGALALADGDPWAALPPLRRACGVWRELGAPYEEARARVLVGVACRGLGDEDAGRLELDAARAAFVELGAASDLAAVASLVRQAAPGEVHGLTPRELQVLRLVAAGETNKAIAAGLVLSERTVDRHVSNILSKLRVPSRAAATAYAYEHELL